MKRELFRLGVLTVMAFAAIAATGGAAAGPCVCVYAKYGVVKASLCVGACALA
jgi:hypothetical protein